MGARDGLIQSGLSSDKAPAVIDALFDLDGISEDVKKLLKVEFMRAHGLGNLNEAELNYRLYQLFNSKEIMEAHFPPPESLWQGELRKEAGLGDARKPLTPEQQFEIRSGIDAAYGVSTRSGPERGFAQQKLLAQQQAERRVIEERDDGRKTSWLDRILG